MIQPAQALWSQLRVLFCYHIWCTLSLFNQRIYI